MPSESPASPLPGKIIILIILIVSLIMMAFIYKTKVVNQPSASPTPDQENKACTLEAKICPDGSAVGRSGPNCEFAECPAASASPADTNTQSLILGPFVGTLPCADCPGLKTELTLTKSATSSAEGTYLMKETYLEKSVQPIVTRGDWTTIRGSQADPNATVYQLDPDKPAMSSYYQKISDTQIVQLDTDKAKINSPFNFTLTLTK